MSSPTPQSILRRDKAGPRSELPVPALGPGHDDVIEQSHERCSQFGLSRNDAADYSPLGRGDMSETRERNQRLHAHAAPVMEMLFEQIVDTQSIVLLTDACGTILHTIADPNFVGHAAKVALQTGVSWAESSKGTNAIGTTLVSEAPTIVYADEHFLRVNHFLSCQASPIFDARGNILGVLDVSSDHRRFHAHTMALVKMSARMIENRWLSSDFHQLMRLHLHTRAEFIGTLMEGILAVGRDGRVVGANRSALDQLHLSSAAVRMHSVTSLFGTTVARLVDHFRSPLPLPLAVRLPDGALCHLRAVFDWATWHHLGESAQDAAPPLSSVVAAPRGGAPAVAAPSAGGSALDRLDTGDAQMSALVVKVRKVIDRDIPVLVLGETGTGKELLARAIHQDSRRARQPFVAVNCASIPESLIESELFGYEDGAFTGARRKGAVGKIVQADGGSLFLDEIGDMPLALQARLLRVLQERQVTPLGSGKAIAVDVALVGATHRDLRQMMEAGTFRDDLYWRLNGLVVKLPPLRQRGDLLTLARAILREAHPERTPGLDAQVVRHFEAYHWPGNVRQLANVLRTAVVMADRAPTITLQHLSDDFIEDAARSVAPPPGALPQPALAADAPRAAEPAATPVRHTLEAVEIDAIRSAVEAAGGNISEASKRLGISRNTIYRKLHWNPPAER